MRYASRIFAIATVALPALVALGEARRRLSFDAYDSWKPMLRALESLKGPDGAQLYEELFFKLKIKFQYPPTSLLPLEFLGLVFTLDLRILNIVNYGAFILNAALLAILAHIVFQNRVSVFSEQLPLAGRYPWMIPAAAFVAGLVFYPVVKAAVLGQLQLWVDLAFTACVLAWCTNRRFAAGLALGFACTLKPQLGMFIAWALVWRQWRFLSGLLALLVPVGLISLLRYGLHNHIAYLDVLSFISLHGETYFANSSVNGILNRLLMNGDLLFFNRTEFSPYHPVVHGATLAATIAFIAMALLPRAMGGRSDADTLHLGAAALCFTMASPIAWEHHYGIMLPLYIVTLQRCLSDAAEEFRHHAVFLLGLSWLLSAASLSSLSRFLLTYAGSPPWNLVHAHIFFGAAVLLGVTMVAANRCGAVPLPSKRPIM